VHQFGRAHHAAAEMLADRLVPEADAEQRAPLRRAGGDQIERDAGLVRRAGAGRDQERLRARGQRLGHGDRVVAHDLDRHAQLLEIMDEVPGEAVIIVEDEDHGRARNKIAGARHRLSPP
jgi:hypothetical protein